MNLEYFIAKRLITTKGYKSSVSSPIIKIAITAIAIGILMMLIAVSTGVGLQDKIREKIASFNGHIVISNFDDNQSQITVEPISIHQNFYPKFKTIEGIQHIQAVATKAGIIRTETAFEGIIFKGVGKEYDYKNLEDYLVSGKIPNTKDCITNDVLISEHLANRLQLQVGSKFLTYFMKDNGKMPSKRKFRISGIYNSGFPEFDAAFVIGSLQHVQLINNWKPNQIGAFEVFITDFSKIKTIGEQVYKEIPPTTNAITIEEKYYSIFEWLKLFDFNIVVILIFMIIVATINMVVALLVLILERTQLIGILKAMGASNWSIRKIFLYNAFHLIIRGLFWGNLIGISLLLAQKYFGIIKLNPENYYVNEAPVSIDLLTILTLNLGTIFICFVVLIIPSYIITKISPIKAILFD